MNHLVETRLSTKRLVHSSFAHLVTLLLWLCLSASTLRAQTTAFTYQGRLSDAGNPANGNYDLQFKLFDALAGGAQQGATLVRTPVAASAGNFTVTLDFGAAVFGGANRFLEIGVRPAGSAAAYTLLAPRQQITSSPYAIQTLNAQQLGGLAASGFVQNTAAQQAGANFNIAGTGTAGNLNVNSAFSLAGSAPPATAPAGQGRIYFDTASNKVRVSENGGAFVNLVGAGGVSGSGTTNTIPVWSGGTTLGDSVITQSANGVQLPNGVQLAVGAQGNRVAFGSPNGETGMSISGPMGRADVRFDGTTLRLLAGPAGGPPSNGIGITSSNVQLPAFVSLALTPQGNGIGFGTPNTETGMTISGVSGRADLRYDGTLKLVNGPGGIPPPTNGIAITTAGNVGIGIASPAAKLHVVGTARTGVLEITGGSDLAEHFAMAEEVKAGMVVAIDAQGAGQLKLARGAYNRRVAGVISGANNLSAGMVLPDVAGAEKSMPVALTGRVWVYCDATGGRIRPGDLLTTSATPGHAMKVTNYARAQGAIIGKAMTELKAGRGLVLVLVSLQ